MEIFNLFSSISTTWGYMNFFRTGLRENAYPALNWQTLVVSLLIAASVWLSLFVLQSIGLYTLAKKAGIRKPWLACVPFVNFLVVEKLTGDCNVFGQRMRHAGLFVMIAQIVNTVLCGLFVAAQIYLYYQGQPVAIEGQLTWQSLSGFARTAYSFYSICYYILSVTQLVYDVLMFILFLALFKRLQPRYAYLFAFLVLFFPLLRFIFVFVFRQKELIDYEAYRRRQREEYIRRQQQYGGYGNPYGGMTGNPYASSDSTASSQSQPTPPSQGSPFSEFDEEEQPSSPSDEQSGESWFN